MLSLTSAERDFSGNPMPTVGYSWTCAAPSRRGTRGFDPFSLVVEDVNGDGKPDLLVAHECADARTRNRRLKCGKSGCEVPSPLPSSIPNTLLLQFVLLTHALATNRSG